LPSADLGIRLLEFPGDHLAAVNGGLVVRQFASMAAVIPERDDPALSRRLTAQGRLDERVCPLNGRYRPFRVILDSASFSRFLGTDRKSTRLNSSHVKISYAVFCL